MNWVFRHSLLLEPETPNNIIMGNSLNLWNIHMLIEIDYQILNIWGSHEVHLWAAILNDMYSWSLWMPAETFFVFHVDTDMPPDMD